MQIAIYVHILHPVSFKFLWPSWYNWCIVHLSRLAGRDIKNINLECKATKKSWSGKYQEGERGQGNKGTSSTIKTVVVDLRNFAKDKDFKENYSLIVKKHVY